MSRRSLLQTFPCQQTFICRACLAARGTTPWTSGAVRQSSSAAAAQRLRPATQGRASPRGRAKPQTLSRSLPRTPPKNQSAATLPIGKSKAPNNVEGAAANLLRDLTHDGQKASLRFFEKDDQGRIKELRDDAAFSDSFSGTGDPSQHFKLDLGSDIRELLQSLKDEGNLEGMGMKNPEMVAKDIEAGLGDLDNPEGMGERLDAYIKNLETQLKAHSQAVGRTLDVDDLEFGDDEELLDMQALLDVESQDALSQIPTERWTFNQRKRLSRLNVTLNRAYKEVQGDEQPSAKTIQSVWKAYSLARQTLAKGWGNVPLDVWDLLWRVLSTEEEAINPKRFTHLSLLARDMSDARVALNPWQQLVSVEAMFVEGFEDKAIENWKRCISTLGDDGSETFKEFWELGVRIFCQKGDLKQAERAVNKLLDRHLDPRILIPYIRSCAAQSNDTLQDAAWNAYRRLRDLLGPSMKLEDYDQVISFFLATNQTEKALFAFVDMMTSGTVDLKGRTHLPSQIGNKFFFGKWLKRLIGSGDLDGAFSVFEFMRSKGIEAASIQINGLIGAWHRNGGTEDMQKADSLAWDMIDSRVKFVRARKRLAAENDEPPADGSVIQKVQVKAKPSGTGPMPKATLETFCLLAENYRARALQKPMGQLWDAFREAEISPDAFMLNQLMESYSQFGNIQEARELYRSLVHDRGVKPDPYTFMALWKMLGANRLLALGTQLALSERELTRQTFAEMVHFSHVFASDGMDGQLARKVLHTFRRLSDPLGLVVALRTLKSVFKFTPPEMLALELAVGTTNLAWDNPRSLKKLSLAKRNMDAFVEARQKYRGALGGEALKPDQMTPEQRSEEMYEYIQSIYLPDTPGVENQLAEVAREMGVYDIVAK